MRLEGKVALVTGGGSGIGRETAILFAREGANVLCVDVDEAGCKKTVELAGQTQGKISVASADVTDSAQVEKAVQTCLDQYGKLDILCHSAGVFLEDQEQRVSEIDPDVWDRIIRINLTGTFLCCRYAIRAMQQNGGGSVINLASMAGLVGSMFHAYSASKGGIISLSRAMAVTYGPDNIRVNAICPGSVETPMTRLSLGAPEIKELISTMVPLGRVAQPGEIAQMALYLASDESAFVTGSTFVIDGGFTAQ